MNKAHELSVLPIRHCFAVDEHTVFLAHYDITVEESLFGIEPIECNGVIVPDGGRFGGGFKLDPTNGIAKYQIPSIDEYTVSFWYKRLTDMAYDYTPILSIDSGSGKNNLIFDFYPKNTNIRCFHYNSDGTYSNPIQIPIDTLNKWNFFVATGEGNTLKLYINGLLVNTSTTKDSLLEGTLNVGRRLSLHQTSVVEGIYDEVRIDRIARNAEEIYAWYQSQSPFYPKGVHRIYA